MATKSVLIKIVLASLILFSIRTIVCFLVRISIYFEQNFKVKCYQEGLGG
ncbi:unnamed protein product, partial [Adineta steineri]